MPEVVSGWVECLSHLSTDPHTPLHTFHALNLPQKYLVSRRCLRFTLPGFVPCNLPFRPCPTEVSQVSLPASPSTSPADPVLQTLKLTRGFPSFDAHKSSLFFRSFKIRTDHKEQRTCMPWCEKRGSSYLIFKPAGFFSSFVSPKRCSPLLIRLSCRATPKCGDQVL